MQVQGLRFHLVQATTKKITLNYPIYTTRQIKGPNQLRDMVIKVGFFEVLVSRIRVGPIGIRRGRLRPSGFALNAGIPMDSGGDRAGHVREWGP